MDTHKRSSVDAPVYAPIEKFDLNSALLMIVIVTAMMALWSWAAWLFDPWVAMLALAFCAWSANHLLSKHGSVSLSTSIFEAMLDSGDRRSQRD